jgi:hypothetical protein
MQTLQRKRHPVNPVEKLPTGIFGPTLSGKTTLAKALVQQYEKQRGMRALVLDPHREKWGGHSIIFTNEEKFLSAVWESKHCIVVIEEASKTIARDGEKTELFTRIRHNFHKLIVSGHAGTNLTPEMRAQIGTLYLFLQTKKTAAIWAEDMADERLMMACQLRQFEFLKKEAYQTPRKMRLSF